MNNKLNIFLIIPFFLNANSFFIKDNNNYQLKKEINNYKDFEQKYINIFSKIHKLLYKEKRTIESYISYLLLKQKLNNFLNFNLKNFSIDYNKYANILFHIYLLNIKFSIFNEKLLKENKKILLNIDKEKITSKNILKLYNKII